MRNREVSLLILIVVVTGLAAWIDFAPDNRWLGRDVSTRLGLDLQGGSQVLLRAVEEIPANEVDTTMDAAARVIEQRVNGLGVSEAVVQRSGTNRIIVELPGVSDDAAAIETLRGTGELEFIDPQGQSLPVGSVVRTSSNPDPIALRPTATATPTSTETLSETEGLTDTAPLTSTTDTEPQGPIYTTITEGRDLDRNSVQPRFGASQNVGNQNPFAVTFAFRGDSAQRLAEFSQRSVQQPMCVVLDNRVYSCPVIQNPLIDGSGEITTQTREDAESMFTQLRYGALPVSLVIESNRTVSATLGQESVDASLLAGIVGLVVVAIFMILYYRLPGLLATIALVIYTAITFAFYRLIPITLTLAGIAGFILSVGVAVDANVLIFARLKEELRRGRPLRQAVDLGFKEAWPAIRDSSVATLITSLILFSFGNTFGVSIVKGFALTLCLGIFISLFTAITVTRTLLQLIVPLGIAQNPWMFELEEASGLDSGRSGDVPV